MELSKKGRNWKGEYLTENNLNSDVLVKWRSKVYQTGNIRNRLVELWSDGLFVRVVIINYIYLVRN